MHITTFLEAARRGEPGADEALLEVAYQSLRRIAANRLGRESGNPTLHPTELVHEAWIRLGGNNVSGWENRFHFFGAAAEAMRRIIIDHARRRQALKRGGNVSKQDLNSRFRPYETPVADELLDLNDALEIFEKLEPVKSNVLKLKFFAGMTIAEIAQLCDISEATVERYWAYAKAWLYQRMHSNCE